MANDRRRAAPFLPGLCTLLLPALALMLVSGCAGRERLTTFERGVEYLEYRDYPRAIEQFKDVVDKEGDSVAVCYNLGICYQDQEKYDEAVEWYERALKVDPRDARTLVNLAAVHMAQGRELTARSLLQRAVEAETDRAYPVVALALHYQRTGHRTEAAEHYRQAAVREEGSAYLWYHWATWYEEGLMYGDAALAYERAAELDASDWVSFEGAGRCYAKLENLPAASKNFDKAIALAPDDPEIYIQASEVLVKMERFERAAQYLWTARGLKGRNDPDIRRRLIDVYRLLLASEKLAAGE